MLTHFVFIKALMSGFNDKKAVDDLYKSGKYEDETDNQLAQGPDEVGKLCLLIYTSNIICYTNTQYVITIIMIIIVVVFSPATFGCTDKGECLFPLSSFIWPFCGHMFCIFFILLTLLQWVFMRASGCLLH